MLQNFIIIHYGEIALKGKNRPFFEDRLVQNIKNQLESFTPESFEYIEKNFGGILVKLSKKGIADIEKVKEALNHTFGISNYFVATSVNQKIDEIKNAAWKIIKEKKFESFRISTQRSDKSFLYTSEQTNKLIGEYVFEKLNKKFIKEKSKQTASVSLKNADFNLKIIILNKNVLLSWEKNIGLGGMPTGTSSRALTLISGGFDSPVAAFQIMRRGVSVKYIHFHSVPYTSRESIEKIKSIVKILKTYQNGGVIYLVPFAEVQKEIMINCPESLRVILYRRLMLKIAEKIARKEKCLALITGDSIGQVASQTMENIFTVSEAISMPVFRPLIGMDKEEIMQKAKIIGTYDISKMPHDDCCTRLMPKKPETRSKLEKVLEAEKNLSIETLIEKTIKNTILEKI